MPSYWNNKSYKKQKFTITTWLLIQWFKARSYFFLQEVWSLLQRHPVHSLRMQWWEGNETSGRISISLTRRIQPSLSFISACQSDSNYKPKPCSCSWFHLHSLVLIYFRRYLYLFKAVNCIQYIVAPLGTCTLQLHGLHVWSRQTMLLREAKSMVAITTLSSMHK